MLKFSFLLLQLLSFESVSKEVVDVCELRTKQQRDAKQDKQHSILQVISAPVLFQKKQLVSDRFQVRDRHQCEIHYHEDANNDQRYWEVVNFEGPLVD